MNKFKKILLGALSVLTLGLVAVTGAKVNATSVKYEYSYDAFNDAIAYANKGDENLYTDEGGKALEWYAGKTINDKVFDVNYFGSFIKLKNGKVSQLGNSTSNSLVSAIDAKYLPSDFDTATYKDSNVGYVSGMKAITNISSLNIKYNNSKGNPGVYYLMITSDDLNYISIKTGDCKNLSLNETISITFNDEKNIYEAKNGTNTVELGTNNKIGYAIVMATAGDKKNLQTTTWITTVSKYFETDALTYKVKFYDEDSVELSNLEKTVIENDNVTSTIAPNVFGKTFKYWAVGSPTGNEFNFDDPVTSDLDLFAVYEEYNTDKYSLSVDYIEYAGDYYGTSDLTDDSILSPTKYSFVPGGKTGNKFYQTAVKVGDLGTSKYAIKTGGSVQSNGGNSLYINLDKIGTFKIYARSGSNTARTIRFYEKESTNAVFEASDSVTNDNTVQVVTVNVDATGEYNIGSNGGVYIYAIEFTPYVSDVTLNFEAQYDANNQAEATKIRFIGTIEGISYSNSTIISSIKFTFTFKDKDRICVVNNLYKSITSGETIIKTSNDDTMYVIYQLNNINKTAYKGEKLTNCKLVVTLTDGSSVSFDRDDIILPDFTTVID